MELQGKIDSMLASAIRKTERERFLWGMARAVCYGVLIIAVWTAGVGYGNESAISDPQSLDVGSCPRPHDD